EDLEFALVDVTYHEWRPGGHVPVVHQERQAQLPRIRGEWITIISDDLYDSAHLQCGRVQYAYVGKYAQYANAVQLSWLPPRASRRGLALHREWPALLIILRGRPKIVLPPAPRCGVPYTAQPYPAALVEYWHAVQRAVAGAPIMLDTVDEALAHEIACRP